MLFGFAAAAVTLAGCGGPPTGTVKGTVTYNNKPVDYGVVTFFVGTEVKQVELAPDGSYVAKEVPYGEAKVEVHSRSHKAEPPSRSQGKQKTTPPPGASKGILIPENYNDKDKSGLKVTVQKGVTEFNIELKGIAE
jgi:hypothetical protein